MKVWNGFSNVLVNLVASLVRLYQSTLSPVIGPRCRFFPSCSNYMLEAIESKGLTKGIFLGAKRICRCHPFGGHGYDPVN